MQVLCRIIHSRFNRRARQLLPLIYLIRHTLNQEVDLSGKILIIDSFPVPVCQPVRNYRVKIFHDIVEETGELMNNTHPTNHYLLGDEGYLGKDLAAKLKHMGYVLWTPYRKNMQGAKKHNNHQLMAVRRTIESDFVLQCRK